MMKGAVLKVYKGAAHGLTAINGDQLNADLLEFAAQKAEMATAARHVSHAERRADQEQRPS
jgi:hypothetical protein